MEEALLEGGDPLAKDRLDDQPDSTGHDAVVSIRNREGPGIIPSMVASQIRVST